MQTVNYLVTITMRTKTDETLSTAQMQRLVADQMGLTNNELLDDETGLRCIDVCGTEVIPG